MQVLDSLSADTPLELAVAPLQRILRERMHLRYESQMMRALHKAKYQVIACTAVMLQFNNAQRIWCFGLCGANQATASLLFMNFLTKMAYVAVSREFCWMLWSFGFAIFYTSGMGWSTTFHKEIDESLFCLIV